MKPFLGVLVLCLWLTGCSSKSNGSPSQPTAPQVLPFAFNGGAIAGFHGNAMKATTTHTFSLVPPVYAQTASTVALTGTYSGYSSQFTGALGNGQGNPNLPDTLVAFPIFGVGTFASICQGQGGTGTCPFATASGSMDAGQVLATKVSPLTVQQGSLAPAFVTGTGSLGPLVVYATSGNVGPLTGASDPVEVWVIRNGQVLNSGITCQLSVSIISTSPASTQRCESTTTFAVQDGDGIIATVTLNPGDAIFGMTFYLVKS
jgi:hypothetical protein